MASATMMGPMMVISDDEEGGSPKKGQKKQGKQQTETSSGAAPELKLKRPSGAADLLAELDNPPATLQKQKDKGKRAASDSTISAAVKKHKSSDTLSIGGKADEPWMLRQPKSFYEATGEEARKLLSERATGRDRHLFKKMNAKNRAAEASECILKLGVLVDGLLSANSAASADKIKELKKKILDLEKDNASFKEINQVLKGKQASLESLVATKDKKIAELETEMAQQVEQFHAREAEIQSAAVAFFQKEYLLSPSGQSFLKILQEGLLEAFLNSKLYLTKLVPAAKTFYKYGFTSAQKQAEDMGCQGEFDSKTPLMSAPPLQGWEGDNDEPVDHPWWLPVLKKAASFFANVQMTKADLEPDLAPSYPVGSEGDIQTPEENQEGGTTAAASGASSSATDLPAPAGDVV